MREATIISFNDINNNLNELKTKLNTIQNKLEKSKVRSEINKVESLIKWLVDEKKFKDGDIYVMDNKREDKLYIIKYSNDNKSSYIYSVKHQSDLSPISLI